MIKPWMKSLAPLAAAAAIALPSTAAATCKVVEDAVGDAAYSNYDIQHVRMNAIGDTLQIQMALATTDQVSVLADYFVHWVDQDGNGWFVGLHPAASVADTYAYYQFYGSYDPETGIYSRTFGNDEAGFETSFGGGLVVATVPLSLVGSPSVMTGVGATASSGTDSEQDLRTGSNSGLNLMLDTTANDGVFNVVENSCGEEEEEEGSPEDGEALANPTNAAELACMIGSGGGSAQPSHSIETFELYTDTEVEKLGAIITLAGDTATAVNTFYRVRWTDDRGVQMWMAAQNADDGNWVFEYGHVEDLAGNSNLVPDGPALGSVEGNVVTIEAKLGWLGFPDSINVEAEADQLVGVGVIGGAFYNWDSTPEAFYKIGTLCGEMEDSGEALESLKAASQGIAPAGGGGALGLLIFGAGLAGLRRRSRQ